MLDRGVDAEGRANGDTDGNGNDDAVGESAAAGMDGDDPLAAVTAAAEVALPPPTPLKPVKGRI